MYAHHLCHLTDEECANCGLLVVVLDVQVDDVHSAAREACYVVPHRLCQDGKYAQARLASVLLAAPKRAFTFYLK
ncbi:hypothetical protein V5799_008067 [Amblyomma americanum]|uniref:Uncharacterized protein n=1 Tax=Amblyomma americanum TaxID=6943 RepID=A0AAQ4FEB4_AMBAM